MTAVNRELFKALADVRHDDDFDGMKEDAKAFFKNGHSAEFYIATMQVLTRAMEQAHDENLEHRMKVIMSMTSRKKA